MALIKCPDCETEVSDSAPVCVKCGRPFSQSKSDPSPVTKKRRSNPVVSLTLFAIIVVIGYKYFIPKESKQAINLVAANAGITITPWIDRAESGLEVLLTKTDQQAVFGESIIGSLHPTGTFHELTSYRIGRRGNIMQLKLTAAWRGGVLGTAYSTTVVWECNEDGPIKVIVAEDNSPFGFAQENLDALDRWFRSEVWLIVNSNAGN